jgi:hypothetical protein
MPRGMRLPLKQPGYKAGITGLVLRARTIFGGKLRFQKGCGDRGQHTFHSFPVMSLPDDPRAIHSHVFAKRYWPFMELLRVRHKVCSLLKMEHLPDFHRFLRLSPQS